MGVLHLRIMRAGQVQGVMWVVAKMVEVLNLLLEKIKRNVQIHFEGLVMEVKPTRNRKVEIVVKEENPVY